MSSRSILGRSAVSLATFSRAPYCAFLSTASWAPASAVSGGTDIVAFRASPPRANNLYSLPLRPDRHISTSRAATMSAEASEKRQAGVSTAAAAVSSSPSPIADNLELVLKRVADVTREGGEEKAMPRLVAVSKTKPMDDLLSAYEAGQRVFGENYAQELIEKSPQMPHDAVFHFIGHLQSNKAKALIAGVPNLEVLETLDTPKLADKLQAACEAAARERPLGVFMQIDTSGEDAKSGVAHHDLDASLTLARHLKNSCPALQLRGVMTIGAPGDMECFDRLSACRDALAAGMGVERQALELSMGMSGDYEEAIRRGSTNVRVGSTIFGARYYPNKKA